MRGLRFTGKERVELQEAPDPHPGPGEAVVRIMASSLCRSDMSLYHGSSVLERKEAVSVIPGHEPCGVVEEVGPGVSTKMLHVGDRVALYLAIGCGHCVHCRSGYLMHCTSFTCIGFDRDGGHAEKLLMPAGNCMRMPDGMSFTVGALSTDKTGTLYHAQKRMGVSARSTIAIFGMGPMGLTGVAVAKALGARIIAIDMLPSRLALAHGIGAETILNPKDTDVVKEIKAFTQGRGADFAIDCTGKEPAQNQMLDSLAVAGKAAFIGETRASKFNVSDQFIRKQIEVMGSWYFPIWEYPEIAGFIMKHKLPLEEKLLSHTFTLSQGQEAFELFDKSETGIVVFKNEGRVK